MDCRTFCQSLTFLNIDCCLHSFTHFALADDDSSRMLISTLSTLVAFSAVAVADFGLVGLGRDLFEPRCCYSCLSSLWGLQLTCTDIHTKRPGDAENNSTSPQCHSTNAVYLSSLAYCISTTCAAENVSNTTTESCWKEVAGDGLSINDLEYYLPSTTPTIQLSYNATILSQVSLVNEQYYQDTRNTIKTYVKQESTHTIYGYVAGSFDVHDN